MISRRLICFALLGLTACGQSFPEAICERVNVTSNGKPVIGVEDMAYDAQTGTLYLSAYDRRAHAKGGIYRLAVESEGVAKSINVTPIIDSIRPHGIDVTHQGQVLTLDFIDRQGSIYNKQPVIRTLSWNDAAPEIMTEGVALIDEKLCASNDLVRSVDGAFFITQDHKTCTSKAQKFENITSPKDASVVIIQAGENHLYTGHQGLSFANGILDFAAQNQLYVAQTRKKRVTVLHDRFRAKLASNITLSGGPDNLTRDGDDIYAALIPSLLKFSRYQKNSDKRIKSRFAIIIPDKKTETHKVTTYGVPASVISGATVAIKAGEHIWLGAGYDTAIARCTLPESAL